MTTPRPHDLLRIILCPSIIPMGSPAWVRNSLTRDPWVVVRRAPIQADYLSVGVRGPGRGHRYGLSVPHRAVTKVVTPEQLRYADLTGVRRLPALDALRRLVSKLAQTTLHWGPTGAVGFELATGAAQVHMSSDLDLIVRADTMNQAERERLHELHTILQDLSVRIDCQVQFPFGGIALNEIISDATELLLRSPDGPRLIPAHGEMP
jgi:phosphoribosyl-dephospho-CoA transferase